MVRTPKQRTKEEDQVEVHIHEPPKSPEDHINQLDTPAEDENLGSSTTTTSNPHPSPSHTTSEQAISRGGALRYRGGPHLSYVFRGRRGLF